LTSVIRLVRKELGSSLSKGIAEGVRVAGERPLLAFSIARRGKDDSGGRMGSSEFILIPFSVDAVPRSKLYSLFQKTLDSASQ
jgi:hypothetical protein